MADRVGIAPPIDVDFELCVDDIAVRLQSIFTARRWPVACLSRWTHVMPNVKLACLGAAMVGVLPKAFAHLGGHMGIKEEEVQRELASLAVLRAQGGEAPDFWWQHCNRVLRVEKFFWPSERWWELAVCLVSAAAVGSLQYALFGRQG